MELIGADGPVGVGGPRQELLLAALLARRRQVVGLDALEEVLWADEPPRTARSTLQTSVSKLRRLIGDQPGTALLARGSGYILEVPPEEVDADRFEAELAAARRIAPVDPSEAFDRFDRAIGLWFGSAFGVHANQPLILPEATRCEELKLQAIEDRNDLRLSVGRMGDVISELEGLTTLEPLRERMWSQLMVALHRTGRQAEALRVADSYRRHLRDELGLDPSAAFVGVERSVVADEPEQLGVTGLASAPSERDVVESHVAERDVIGPHLVEHQAAEPQVLEPTTGHASPRGSRRLLPSTGLALIGRESTLDELESVVATSRLITLTGPGGVGKSTLAVEVARRLGPEFRDGVRMVEFAPLADEDSVVAAVAQAVDAERRFERSLTQAVVDVLSTQDILLMLDNCEHLVTGVAALVTDIVRWCPQVTIIATSREPLGLAGEVVHTVAPLTVPADPNAPIAELTGNPAVEVFVTRARQSASWFELTHADATAVAELCIQLDGLPLALELAASRMSSMTPRELLDRMNERFVLLGGGTGRTPRHRTLADVVRWSYALLDERNRSLFARLSVFAGGFDIEAAESACAGGGIEAEEVAGVLASLADRSLVVATPSDGRFRYTMLETIRSFAADRLAEQADPVAVHRSHVRTFAERAQAGRTGLDGPDESQWAAMFDRDNGNFRVAVNTAISLGDVDAALRLVVSVAEAGSRSIRYEVIDWTRQVVNAPQALDHPLGPTALAILGYGSFIRGELDTAISYGEQAIQLREQLNVDPCGMPERVLGNAHFYLGDRDVAVQHIAKFAEITREFGTNGRHAHALYMHSVAQTSVGNLHQGEQLANEALAVAAQAGSATARSQASYAAGLALAHSNRAKAIEHLEQSAGLAESVGNRWMQSFALTESLWLRALGGDSVGALSGYREVVETWFRGGDWANQWLSLRHLAGILASLGHDENAAVLAGAVEAAGAESALPFAPADADELNQLHVALSDRMGDGEFARLRESGARLRDDAAIAVALTAIDSVLNPH